MGYEHSMNDNLVNSHEKLERERERTVMFYLHEVLEQLISTDLTF